MASGSAPQKKRKDKQNLKYEFTQLQYKLSSHFGTKVHLKCDDHSRGEIKIPFASEDDLNRILELLSFA